MTRKKSSTKNQVEENTVKIGRFVAQLMVAVFLVAVIIYSIFSNLKNLPKG